MEPTATQRFGIGFGVLPVSIHHAIAAGDHLADLAGGHVAIINVDDPDQHAGACDAARAEPL
jgi:hypothetical protein